MMKWVGSYIKKNRVYFEFLYTEESREMIIFVGVFIRMLIHVHAHIIFVCIPKYVSMEKYAKRNYYRIKRTLQSACASILHYSPIATRDGIGLIRAAVGFFLVSYLISDIGLLSIRECILLLILALRFPLLLE